MFFNSKEYFTNKEKKKREEKTIQFKGKGRSRFLNLENFQLR